MRVEHSSQPAGRRVQISSYAASHTVVHPIIERSWTLLTPIIVELSHHHLAYLDEHLREDPAYSLFRHEVLPRLIGCSYEAAPVRETPSGIVRRRASGQLAADQIEDAWRCLNLMRAKAWHLQRSGQTGLETYVLEWLQHLSLQFSLRDDIAEVNVTGHGDNVYSIMTQGRSMSDVESDSTDGHPNEDEGLLAARLNLVLHDKFLPLIDFVEVLEGGLDELERFLDGVIFTIRQTRLRSDSPTEPEYANTPFQEYDGSLNEANAKGSASAGSRPEPAPSLAEVLKISAEERSNHLLMTEWHQKRMRTLLDADPATLSGLDHFQLTVAHGFHDVRTQAQRWRWLTSVPGAIAQLRQFMSTAPKALDSQDIGEYLSICVDIQIHESGWVDGAESGAIAPEPASAQDADDETDALWWSWLMSQQPARFAQARKGGARPSKASRGADDDWLEYIEAHLGRPDSLAESSASANGAGRRRAALIDYLTELGATPHSPRARRPLVSSPDVSPPDPSKASTGSVGAPKALSQEASPQ